MAYTLAEIREPGGATPLGEPIEDLVVAKVIAARRAIHSRCVTIVADQRSGEEIARYDPNRAPNSSERRVRTAIDRSSEWSETTLTRKKLG
jgi:hypothetical protein